MTARPAFWSGIRPLNWILLCGVNSGLVYLLIFFLPYPLIPAFKVPQPAIWNFEHFSAPLLGLGWIILFQLYYLAYRLCPARPSRLVLGLLVAFPVVFSSILLFMYPVGSNDIFDQIFRGHIFAQLHANPYVTTPDHFPQDPLLPYVNWKNVPGTYGPIWELLTGLITKLVGPDLLSNVIGYKLLVIGHFWASFPVVYGILRVLYPAHAARGLLLFAWNPLVLMEAAGSAHNDFLLVFWMLVAVYFLVRAHHALALLALTAAILVKFIPVLLVPLFLVALWRSDETRSFRDRIGHQILVLTAMGVMAVATYLPFDLRSMMTTMTYANDMTALFHESTSWMILHLLEGRVVPYGPVGQSLVRNSLLLLMIGVILWHSFRLWRQQATGLELTRDLIQRCFDILFVYLVIVTPWFHPWHAVWLIAFAPFVPRFGYAERTVLFFFLVISDYFIWWYRWPIGSPVLEVAESMVFWVIFPLPFLLSLGLWFYRQGRALWSPLPRNAREAPTP